MIIITAKKDGFRRCGIAHSKQAVEHPNGTFSAEQLEILKKEPMLVVQVTEGGDEPGKEKRLNAKDTIALVKTCASVEELDAAAADNTDRQSVLDAIAKRRTELETPPE